MELFDDIPLLLNNLGEKGLTRKINLVGRERLMRNTYSKVGELHRMKGVHSVLLFGWPRGNL